MKKMYLLLITLLLVFVSSCDQETYTYADFLSLEINEITTSSVVFSFLENEGNKSTFKHIELRSLDLDTIITESDEITNRFDDLLSGHSYQIRLTSEIDGELYTASKNFNTKLPVIPTAKWDRVVIEGLLLNPDVKISDVNNTGSIKSINLYRNGALVESTRYVHEMYLEYNSSYELELIYEYDLGDGEGKQEIIDIFTFEIKDEVTNYFIDIALGFEFGSASLETRKWNKPMKLYIDGEPTAYMLSYLNTLIEELNGYFTDGFYIEIVDSKEASNADIFFGTGDEFSEQYNVNKTYTESNLGLFFMQYDGHNHFTYAKIFITTEYPDELIINHLIREELTQSLGLARDSYTYPDSIFYQGWNDPQEFTELDIKLIKILYSNHVDAGWDETDVLENFPAILEELFE